MKTITRIAVAVLFLPILLTIDNFKSSRSIVKKIFIFLVIWIIIGFTWIRGYRNLFDASKLILFNLGLTDKLTNVQVQGESMLPTIKNGETLTLHNPHKFPPVKGDIVSFQNIETSDVYYMKRIIATEGEQILLENGQVKINGKVLTENYVYNNSPTYGNTFIFDCKPYTVPKGKVVVMGDNRVASTDSRIIGFVDLDDIEGVIKTGVKPTSTNTPTTLDKQERELDIAAFIRNLNEKRKQRSLMPLSEVAYLSESAQEKAKLISENIDSWKQKEGNLSKELEEKGYNFLLIQEVITMGNYDDRQLSEHVLELYPYNQDFLSDKYFDIGVGVSEATRGTCTSPVIVIILGWPSNPNYSQEIIESWDKDIEAFSNLITALKELKTNVDINPSETQELIDKATSLLNDAHSFRNILLEKRWPTESELQETEGYRQELTDFQKKLAEYVSKYSEKIDKLTVRTFLEQYKWGNPEFNVKSQETQLLFGQGKYQELLKSAQELLNMAKTDEEKAIAHYWQGLAYYNLENPGSAKANLLEAVRLNPKYAAPYVTLAALSFSEGNYQQGLTHAQKCVELDPNYGWCHNNLGLAYAYLGQKDKAISELERAVELDPTSYVFATNLTRIKSGN